MSYVGDLLDGFLILAGDATKTLSLTKGMMLFSPVARDIVLREDITDSCLKTLTSTSDLNKRTLFLVNGEHGVILFCTSHCVPFDSPLIFKSSPWARYCCEWPISLPLNLIEG